MTRSYPTPDEERWLAVADRLGAALPRDALADRTGGWRTTGPLARIALFVLGQVAASLTLGILGFGSQVSLLLGGLVVAGAAEWLIRAKRLHASGIEEGLCLAGWLMVGGWAVLQLFGDAGAAGERIAMLVLIVVAAAAGVRLLNPLVTTCAALALLAWLGSLGVVRMLDAALGAGLTTFTVGIAAAAAALAAGATTFHRPSHDRMLDWLVATLPLGAYAQHAAGSPIFGVGVAATSAGARIAVIAMLVSLGVTALVVGLRRRRHAPLLCAMGCAACAAIEVRLATGLSTEAWLIGGGLLALAAGLVLDRRLRAGRAGLTSAKITEREGPLDLLHTAGATVLAQRGTPAGDVQEAPAATGAGGRFGGGGASGSY